MSELRLFLETFRAEQLIAIREALTFESGSCEVSFRVGNRLVTRRIVMPVAERTVLSVRGLNGVAHSVRDTEPGLSDFAKSVTDWAMDVLSYPAQAFEPEENGLESPAKQAITELEGQLRDPRAIKLLKNSGLGHQSEHRPSEPDQIRLEAAALRWLLGKLIAFAEDDRTDLAYVRSQHVRRALDRAGLSLPAFREAHQQALQSLLESVEPPYWELDDLLIAPDTSSVDHRYSE